MPRNLRGQQDEEEELDVQDTDPLLPQEQHEVPEPSWRMLLLLRSLYFLGGISGATWGRFGTVYYNQKGLDQSHIGIIEGTMPLVVAAVQPFWGVMGDKYFSPKSVYLFTRTVGAAILMLFALPQIAHGFRNLYMISIGISLFVAGGVLDAFTLNVLGPHAKRLYGRLRMWTALSWGAGTFAMGIINDHYGFGWNFVLYAAFAVIQLLAVGFSVDPTKRSKSDGAPLENPQKEVLMKVLTHKHTIAFFVEIFVFAMGMGVIEKGLLFVFMIRDLKASTTLCGACVGVTVLFELPVFQYSEKILQTLGHDGIVSIAYCCYIVRVFGYTMLTPETKHWILALELLHGFTFAGFWIAAVEHTRALTPPGWSSTMQSLLTGTYQCFGQGIGAIAGGFVMKHLGSAILYRSTATMVTALLMYKIVIALFVPSMSTTPTLVQASFHEDVRDLEVSEKASTEL